MSDSSKTGFGARETGVWFDEVPCGKKGANTLSARVRRR